MISYNQMILLGLYTVLITFVQLAVCKWAAKKQNLFPIYQRLLLAREISSINCTDEPQIRIIKIENKTFFGILSLLRQ